MKTFRIVFALLLILSIIFSGCQKPREIKTYTIQDFLKTTSFARSSFSPDNSKILVSSNKTGIFNAYTIAVSGGEPVQLTNSGENSIFVRGYFPQDERFLFSSDQGGNELNHVYVRELDGTEKDLTPGEGHKARMYFWAWDDKTFYVETNERDKRFFDIYEYSADDYSRTMIYKNESGYDFSDVSPDRRYMAFSKTHTRTNSDIYLYDTQTQKMDLLTEHEGQIVHNPMTFSADGKSLYFLTDKDSEFQYLVKHDMESGSRETVFRPEWDVMSAYFSKTGKYLIVRINNDARTELKIFEGSTMKEVSLPRFPDAEISSVGVSRDESRLAFYASASRNPRDLYYYEFAGKEPVRLTSSLNPKINSDDLVSAKVVRFKSFDGVEIPGILYKPHQATSSNKAPALVWVHGGPGGQSRVRYSSLIQYLVNHGYVVYAINNRGSGGYGKTFYRMDDQKHGKGDLDDCVTSKKMLAATGYVDPERIGIIGGSYGGYMVLAALAFRPEEFAVGVDIFGVSNWVRTLQSIPPWWESYRKALEDEMGDFEDTEYLTSISPLFHAEKIVKPMIVLQGANDPRVLKAESDEIVEAVKKNNVPVEYVVFDDEGHGFMKNENREEGYKAILDFLDKHLKAAPQTTM